ncbi:DUF5060 domain-containing protein [Aureibaculum algae]|uniref:DUF5060 domain-containing protein n=1 Tax=Aureibaculum algae TaxID=2584122 RepID=UPI002029C764|nr:DUF5060 domain-containing protein [Aureibaculum algae]
MKNNVLSLLIFCIVSVSTAQIKTIDYVKAPKKLEITQWQVNDISFHTKKTVENPFEQQVTATVTSANGVQEIPLFYNGNSEWIFRYSANKVGEITYKINSTVKEFHNKKGAFNAVTNTKKD